MGSSKRLPPGRRSHCVAARDSTFPAAGPPHEQESPQRARHLHQVHYPGPEAGWLGRVLPNPRRGQLHQGPYYRSRQAGHPRQSQARRLHPLLQAQHPPRHYRGQGQQPRHWRRHPAGPRIRRHPQYPLRLLQQWRRLRVPRSHWGQPAEGNHPPPGKLPNPRRPLGPLPVLERHHPRG